MSLGNTPSQLFFSYCSLYIQCHFQC
jgi:hypothetical protein